MIAIGSDHGGYELKGEVIAWLKENNYEYMEFGCMDGNSIDYPNVAEEVCAKVLDGTAESAILLCGTGTGISMAANKINGIRAALCTDTYMAKYTRLHNNSNTLCMGGRVLGAGAALEIVDTFLHTGFEGGRHQRRIDLLTDIENKMKG